MRVLICLDNGTTFKFFWKPYEMKSKNLIFLAFLTVVLLGCSATQENTEATTWTLETTPTTGEQLLSGEDLELNGVKWSWEQVEELVVWEVELSGYFWIGLCDEIIQLYHCIIDHAPLENQPVMRNSLEQVIEPRRHMADPQVQEICQEIRKQETFQEVMQHYTSTGQNLGCSFWY